MSVQRKLCPSLSKGSGAWNTAVMTRRESPSATARMPHSMCAARQANWAIWKKCCASKPLEGTFGIGHTRWATHGRPTEENAHPHRDCTGRIVVVHNGIVENYLELKRELIGQGHKFVTETDTEIIAHLIEQVQKDAEAAGKPILLEVAVRRAVKRLTGAFALGVLSAAEPDKIVAARFGPPVVIGVGEGESFVASDVPGILHHTRNIYFLADGDMAILTPSDVTLTDFDGNPIERATNAHPVGPDPGGKGRLQALHAQGNLGAAAGHPRHHAGPRLARFRQSLSGRNGDRRRGTCAAQRASTLPPAAPVGTRRSPANT